MLLKHSWLFQIQKVVRSHPLDAIREALINALVHRNYQSSTDIQIKIFDQSISFFNPSGLYGNITEMDLMTDTYTASTRNKLIAEAFYLTNDIEKFGSGFVRIRKAIADYPTMKFVFRNAGHGFFSEFSYETQKIHVTTVETTVDTTVETLLQLMKQNSKITQTQLMYKLSLSRRGIEWQINNLKQKGKIKIHGAARGPGGYWQVLDEGQY